MKDQTLPIRGGWVLIKRRLPTGIQVPLLSIFYALPARLFLSGTFSDWPPFPGGRVFSEKQLELLWRHRNKGKLSVDDVREVKGLDAEGVVLEQRVRITTPDGDVCVEPHEWVPVTDVSPFFDVIGSDVILHEMGGIKRGKLPDEVFYLRTRGISKIDAYRMLLGEIQRPNVVWLETPPEYAEILQPQDIGAWGNRGRVSMQGKGERTISKRGLRVRKADKMEKVA